MENIFTSDLGGKLLRHGLTAGAGVLVAKGLLAVPDVEAAVGLVMGAISTGYMINPHVKAKGAA